MGQSLPFTSEVTRSLPDRVRLAILLDKKFPLVTVLNGDKGWQQSGGATGELSPERVQELREEAYVWWLTTLVPLRQDPFTLTPLPDAKVGDQAAAVVRVSSPGHPDAKLFFDKRSGPLLKIERRASETGVLVDKEYLYADFKEFDGVTLPTKESVLINGKKWTETTLSSCKFPREVDKDAFTRP